MTDDIKDYLEELADEYCVDPEIVYALYDMMPNELYDGLVMALEDYNL